jgi:GntR family transcriptional regulator
LAVQLHIKPSIVRRAYSQLKNLGILNTRQGTGTYISHRKIMIGEKELEHKLQLSWMYSWLSSNWI